MADIYKGCFSKRSRKSGRDQFWQVHILKKLSLSPFAEEVSILYYNLVPILCWEHKFKNSLFNLKTKYKLEFPGRKHVCLIFIFKLKFKYNPKVKKQIAWNIQLSLPSQYCHLAFYITLTILNKVKFVMLHIKKPKV